MNVFNLIVLDGSFYASIEPTGTKIEVVANTDVFGSIFNVAGGIQVIADADTGDITGVAAVLDLLIDRNGWTYSLSGEFSLRFNTTTTDLTLAGIVLKAETLSIFADGKLEFLSVVSIKGTFDLLINSEGFDMSLSGIMQAGIFGNMGVTGMEADSNGLVGVLNSAISDGVEVLPEVVFDGSFLFAINITDSDVNSKVLDIDPDAGDVLGEKDVVLVAYSMQFIFGGEIILVWIFLKALHRLNSIRLRSLER